MKEATEGFILKTNLLNKNRPVRYIYDKSNRMLISLLLLNIIISYLPSQFYSFFLSFFFILLIIVKAQLITLYRIKFFHSFFSIFIFSILMLLINYDNDFSFWSLVVNQGLLKGFALPLIGILTLAALNFDFFKFFKLHAILGIVLATLFIFFGNANSFSLNEGTPKSLSLILLFSIPYFAVFKFNLRAFLFSIFLGLYYLYDDDIYKTSADFATGFISLALSLLFRFFSVRKFLIFLLFSPCFFIVFSGFDIYVELLKIGLTPSSAHKIAAPFSLFPLVLDSGFELVPWTAHVRYVELINSLDRSWFNNIFGSGVFSTITESSEYYRAFLNNGSDYTAVEIQSGKYFSLHNLPRGVLHFGLIYFILIFWWYIKLILFLIKNKNIKYRFAYFYLLHFLFISALWNPYISNIFFIYILHNKRYNLPIINNREN